MKFTIQFLEKKKTNKNKFHKLFFVLATHKLKFNPPQTPPPTKKPLITWYLNVSEVSEKEIRRIKDTKSQA